MYNFKLNILVIGICFSLGFISRIALAANNEEGNQGYIVGSPPAQRVHSDSLKEEVDTFSEKILEYYIALGDVLEISVWQIPELSKDVIVRPDGKISYPLIGDIEAYGLTLSELDDILTKKLSVYVRKPQVSIAVKNFGGNKIFVLGEVKSPGTYKFTGNTRIIEVISEAGGFTTDAETKSVIIIRGQKKPRAIRVNLASVLKRANLSQNIIVRPYDIVYVPRSFIGNLNLFLNKISPSLDAYPSYKEYPD
jgi:polysaccharide export outer membrane protein